MMGQPLEAAPELLAALAIDQKLADDDPAEDPFRVAMPLTAFNGLDWMLAQRGKPAQAEAELRVALALFRKPVEDKPKASFLRDSAARIYNNLSVVLRRLGRPA